MNRGGEFVEEEKFNHRILLLSDPHYMPNESVKEYKELYPDSNPCGAIGDALGYTQTEKMAIILNDVREFAKDTPIEAVLVLGDLSTDDCGYRRMAENYVQKFKDEVMLKFPCVSYALPGNHDSHANDIWHGVFGYNRQHSVKIGDSAFVLLDTYRTGDTVSAAGAPYTGVDVEWLERELEKYPTERIYLCSHYFRSDENNERFEEVLKRNDRIVCCFHGHTHKNNIRILEKWSEKPMIDLGGYAYQGEQVEKTWRFDRFDETWAWGFGVLEWNDTEAHYYHIKNPRRYVGRNGCFDYVGAVENEITINFK